MNDSAALPAAIDRSGARSCAVVAVTLRGSIIAARLAESLPAAMAYVPERFLALIADVPASGRQPSPVDRGSMARSNLVGYAGGAALLVADLFRHRRALVLVMATGAAVRLVAPFLLDKRSDPAVVSVDDTGRYAISLVSGHLGGANALAQLVAERIGAQAIITTASESAHVPSADLIGRDLGWTIEPNAALTAVAAAMVNGETVAIYQDCGSRSWLEEPPPVHMVRVTTIEELRRLRPAAAIVISDRILPIPADLTDRYAIYRPPTLVVGAGCSRGAPCAEIARLVDGVLEQGGLSPLSVAALATIDRKAGEPGLVALARDRGWPLRTFSAEELEGANGDWTRSETVRQAVGTGGVAEPAALLAAGAPALLVRKLKSERATAAVARIPAPSFGGISGGDR